jgi:hypothetical protein
VGERLLPARRAQSLLRPLAILRFKARAQRLHARYVEAARGVHRAER